MDQRAEEHYRFLYPYGVMIGPICYPPQYVELIARIEEEHP
jgi:hypothetical protein